MGAVAGPADRTSPEGEARPLSRGRLLRYKPRRVVGYHPDMEGDFVYDQDPTGARLVVQALNSAYVVLTVTDEDDRSAKLLITPQALRDAAAAAEEMTS